MQFFVKFSAIVLLLAIATTAGGYFFWYRPAFHHKASNHYFYAKAENEKTAVLVKIRAKALALKEYAKINGYNTTHCFMVDMHIASGKQRFMVYNLLKDSIELAGLVTHGSGSDKGGEELHFSNTPNSNCTSLGKYKIGRSYFGKFGLAYKLYGLDKSNNRAYERFVVLHAHSCVPDAAVNPLQICQSWGCPTVSPAFLTALKKYIDKSPKPVLMDIYY
jgi:L,D-transpeptidase catalytic domain